MRLRLRLRGGRAMIGNAQGSIAELLAPATGDVPDYFRSIGFEVDWDFNQDGLHWYEVIDGKTLLLQIDYGAPLADLMSDLPRLARGEASSCASSWEVRGPIEGLRRVVDRMSARSVA